MPDGNESNEVNYRIPKKYGTEKEVIVVSIMTEIYVPLTDQLLIFERRKEKNLAYLVSGDYFVIAFHRS